MCTQLLLAFPNPVSIKDKGKMFSLACLHNVNLLLFHLNVSGDTLSARTSLRWLGDWVEFVVR